MNMLFLNPQEWTLNYVRSLLHSPNDHRVYICSSFPCRFKPACDSDSLDHVHVCVCVSAVWYLPNHPWTMIQAQQTMILCRIFVTMFGCLQEMQRACSRRSSKFRTVSPPAHTCMHIAHAASRSPEALPFHEKKTKKNSSNI
jgi:hypothetical protein